MPNKVIKKYSKKSNKSTSTVDKIWKDTEKKISKQYPDIKKGSSKYYALVNSVVRKRLKLEDIEEESQASTTTTTANIGAGMSGAYPKRMLAPSKKEIKTDDLNRKKVLKSFKG